MGRARAKRVAPVSFTQTAMQTFAIIPAAGRSQRMGRPKLLLPWGATTVIAQVIAAWRASRVDRAIMVVHPDDLELAATGRTAGAEVVVPDFAPPDMKASVCVALDCAQRYRPLPSDAWLVAPADMPGLSTFAIDAVIAAYQREATASPTAASSNRVWVAAHHGRRGHPALFPWSLAAEVRRLGDAEGLDALLRRHEVILVEAGPARSPAISTRPKNTSGKGRSLRSSRA